MQTTKQKTFSIIIPTYNESQNILRLADPVHNNLPPDLNCEIIIVDNDSPDGTGKIVLENYVGYEKMKVVIAKSNDDLSFSTTNQKNYMITI